MFKTRRWASGFVETDTFFAAQHVQAVLPINPRNCGEEVSPIGQTSGQGRAVGRFLQCNNSADHS